MTGVEASRTWRRATRSTSATARCACCTCRATRRAASGCGTRAAGALFTGDVIYDSGTLLDELKGSYVPDYLASMERLLRLPVEVVYSGHGEPFGRALLHERARAYLDLAGLKSQARPSERPAAARRQWTRWSTSS